ncbi:sialate O-acetylesterase [Chitinophaga sancti]|uniref:sialate O-acetylesterase n=1 Tax=Chitinophaga sancti TaxID=1004 RepID=UPI003F7AA8FE
MKWILFSMLFSVNAMGQTIFLAAGQSNAVGMADSAASVQCVPGTAFEYRYGANTLVHLKDPVGAPDLKFENAQTGSAWPAFAKAYHELTGKKVVIVPAARGGSSCSYKAELEENGTWDTTGRLLLFDSALVKARAAMKLCKKPIAGILWSQGERDANAVNASQLTPAEYEEQFVKLIGRFRKELGMKLPFYIIQTGHFTGHSNVGFDGIRQAQEHVATRLKNVYIVYSQTTDFEKKGWMQDPIHYNQTALNEIGAVMARQVVLKEKKKT